MKKVLGLDLGVGSVGWALIELDSKDCLVRILGMGVRRVEFDTKVENQFKSGAGITVCSERTARRTARKCYDRYQMRRAYLKEELAKHQMLDTNNALTSLDPAAIWGLRAKAATRGERLTLPEIGRVLLHLNQKRGYMHAKADASDSKQTKYVKEVNERYKKISSLGMTPGQYFYSQLLESRVGDDKGGYRYTYRIKEQTLPRHAFAEEFDRIMETQSAFYQELLTPEFIDKLKQIIFYQRPLKSCKHLVSRCEFVVVKGETQGGIKFTRRPKVAPKSSPLAQVERIYEAINNIRLTNINNKKRKGKEDIAVNSPLEAYEYRLSAEEREAIFKALQVKEKIDEKGIFKCLNINGEAGFKLDKASIKGLKGNTTYVALHKALDGAPNRDALLAFDLEYVDSNRSDQETGEVFPEVSADYINQPLYRLWHLVYSISNRDELAKALAQEPYKITDDKVIDCLFALDFVKDGYSNKSSNFMRQLIPYLQEGLVYSDAAEMVGVNHSNSVTSEENEKRELKSQLVNLTKGELRQPIVEKVLNQMINVVNALLLKYGEIDEIRVELARELKQSKEDRDKTAKNNQKREKENDQIVQILIERGLSPSKRNIQKYRLFEETSGRCLYCNEGMYIDTFLGGHGGEIEHIIPRSLLFDDSFANKACSCRKCNQEKGQQTAYDFMAAKSEVDFHKYIERVKALYDDGKISKTKYQRLTTTKEEIPQDFLNRDLSQTQYIAKKAKAILMDVCRNVYASSGTVTSYLRNIWGYEDILHTLNLPRYEKGGLTYDHTYQHNGQNHTERRIKDWGKRLDHRHHAIDALVIALTRQGYIQKLNTLSSSRDEMFDEATSGGAPTKEKFHLVERWAETRPHFSVAEVQRFAETISVTSAAKKKSATSGKRYIFRGGKRKLMQSDIIVPRGAMHEENVYGKIKLRVDNCKLEDAFSAPHLIVDSRIKALVEACLSDAKGDIKAALKVLKKSPLLLEDGQDPITAIDCFVEKFVFRYALSGINYNKATNIIDPVVREAVLARFEECGNNEKKFQASVIERPVTVGPSCIPVKSVRCDARLSPDSVVEVRRDAHGKAIGYCKTGSNDHVAFYRTADGKVETRVLSTWEALNRRRLGVPVIVSDPSVVWAQVNALPESDLKREVIRNLPAQDWTFINSMRMHEMFILGLSDEEINDAFEKHDMATLNAHLYRMQVNSYNDYVFRLHTYTLAERTTELMNAECFHRVKSYKRMEELNPVKVRINCIGDIEVMINKN